MPIEVRGGGIVGASWVSRFRGFGRRGGTRRLKFATTSGGECLLRVGWAKRLFRLCVGGKGVAQRLTPSARVWVVDGGIDVAQVDFAHEAVNLWRRRTL